MPTSFFLFLIISPSDLLFLSRNRAAQQNYQKYLSGALFNLSISTTSLTLTFLFRISLWADTHVHHALISFLKGGFGSNTQKWEPCHLDMIRYPKKRGKEKKKKGSRRISWGVADSDILGSCLGSRRKTCFQGEGESRANIEPREHGDHVKHADEVGEGE